MTELLLAFRWHHQDTSYTRKKFISRCINIQLDVFGKVDYLNLAQGRQIKTPRTQGLVFPSPSEDPCPTTKGPAPRIRTDFKTYFCGPAESKLIAYDSCHKWPTWKSPQKACSVIYKYEIQNYMSSLTNQMETAVEKYSSISLPEDTHPCLQGFTTHLSTLDLRPEAKPEN